MARGVISEEMITTIENELGEHNDDVCFINDDDDHPDEQHGETIDDISNSGNDNDDTQSCSVVSQNKFCVDYSKRGTAKCRRCKKVIEKNWLRIGKFVVFRGKIITHYYHLNCAFAMFEKARLLDNVVKDLDELDGVDSISEDDQQQLTQAIKVGNDKRVNERRINANATYKIPVKKQVTSTARKKKLTSRTEPAIKIMLANADQLTTTKKDELLALIQQEQPMIVAITEAKPKNSTKERSTIDYEIENYSLHPINLVNTDPGRGVAVYTHKSLESQSLKLQQI